MLDIGWWYEFSSTFCLLPVKIHLHKKETLLQTRTILRNINYFITIYD